MTIDIFGLSALDDEARKEIIRTELHNLTTSYSDEADVFTEIVQNAVDAITDRTGADSAGPGQLSIVIGRRANNAHYVYVQDDGIGMSSEIVDKVFIPNFSHGKKRGRTLGYKGVGMSYVLAVSDHISIQSVQAGKTTSRTVLHTNGWVEDDEKPSPLVTNEFRVPALVADLASAMGSHGTGVYFAFHPGSKPDTLDGLVRIGDGGEAEVDYWAGLLCARTPLGLAVPASKIVSDPIGVRLILDFGDEQFEKTYSRSRFDLDSNSLGYPFPETVFKVSKDTAEIVRTDEADRHVVHHRKYHAVHQEWDASELINEIDNLDDDERTLLGSHLNWVRGYYCYSTDVMNTVRQRLGARRQVVRYGVRLVVDGAPQGRPLELTLTSDQGLERQMHIVLGFSELGLDTGRKIVSDERLVSAINKVAQRAVTRLKGFRWALKIKNRPDVAADLEGWRNRVASAAGTSTIPKLFEALGAQAPSHVDPDSEQEVIALWTALLTAQALPGFQMKAISGFNRYDALIDIGPDSLTEEGNLGVITTDYTVKPNAVLEFKVQFESLIADFEEKKKRADELDLVVVWDLPSINQRQGRFEPKYGQWSHGRGLRGESYTWSDDTGTNTFPVIALRNLVAELLVDLNQEVGRPYLEILETRDKDGLV